MNYSRLTVQVKADSRAKVVSLVAVKVYVRRGKKYMVVDTKTSSLSLLDLREEDKGNIASQIAFLAAMTFCIGGSEKF